MNVATTALLTDMNQPLGGMVGNAVEVQESIDALEGRGPEDLMEVTFALGAELVASAKNPRPWKEWEQTSTGAPERSALARHAATRGGFPDDSALTDDRTEL
jgi:thymidine phosphorylase